MPSYVQHTARKKCDIAQHYLDYEKHFYVSLFFAQICTVSMCDVNLKQRRSYRTSLLMVGEL